MSASPPQSPTMPIQVTPSERMTAAPQLLCKGLSLVVAHRAFAELHSQGHLTCSDDVWQIMVRMTWHSAM